MSMSLKEFKEKYKVYEKKYGLPNFKELNEDFEIEKVADKDSDCFLRIVRKAMMEKIVNFLGFLEMLMNPVSAPRVYHYYIGNMQGNDKKAIEEVYKNFGDLSLNALALEAEYSEKTEAEMIKSIGKRWNEMRPRIKEILSGIRNPGNNAVRKEKTYFG